VSTPRFKLSDPVDFLIIGAGAAGGVVVKELSRSGFNVVVLEQGPYLRETDYSHDEIRYTFQPGLTNDPKIQPITYRKTAADPAKPLKAIEYGRQVGGGSVHFTANYWRFHESDFHERSLYGDIPGTGFADWPITYADLEPYYTEAEYDLGISGLAGANPFEAPRSKPYPLPPMPVKSSGVLFERATKKLGLHPYPAPVAILSQPYRGRGACMHCGFWESFGCEMLAKVQHARQRDSSRRENRPLRNPVRLLRQKDRDRCARPRHRRHLLRAKPPRSISARQSNRLVRQRR